MTKRSLSSKVRVVAIIYAISIAALLGARWRAPFAVYDTLKDSIPLIIAIVRKKGNVVAIGALNLLLGWTLVGWVVSLVWSLSKDQQPQQVVIHQTIAGGTGTTYGVEPRNDA